MVTHQQKKSYKTENNPGESIFPRDQKHYSYNVARLKLNHNGEKHVFEIDIDPDLAVEFRHGADIDVRNVLKVQRIFSDVSTALFAKNNVLNEVFGTEDVLVIAKNILLKGEIQPCNECEVKLHEAKKKSICDALKKSAIVTKTGKSLTDGDLNDLLEKSKVKVDIHEPDSWLLRKVVERSKSILPLTIEIHTVQLTLAPQYVSKVKYPINKLSKILKEETLSDGSWQVTAEVPVGVKDELFNNLNSLTHGKFGSKLLRG